MINICITGHRKLLYPGTVREQIRSSLQYFQARYKDKEEVVAITAMASGSDTIFAEEALDLGIAVKAIFPFAASEYQKDFSPEEWQRVQAVINNKKRPVQLEIANTLSSFAEQEKKNAYLNTGVQLVDDANIVLAVWDGLAPQGAGGTADIVRYATGKNKELHIIKGLRQEVDGKLPVEDNLQSEFETFDNAAIQYKKRFQQVWKYGIVLGVLAAISFSIGIAVRLGEAPGSHRWHHYKFLLGLGEVVCLLFSFWLLLKRAPRWKNAFLDNRRKAEYLRSVLWFRDAGIPIPPVDPKGYSPGINILDKEKEVAASITGISNLSNARRMTWCLANMQITYHEKMRIAPFTHWKKIIEQRLWLIKMLFIIIVGLNFSLELYEYLDLDFGGHLTCLHPWLILGWMSLPPVYAALEGVKHFTEWKTHIAKSEKINEELKKISNEVIVCADAGAITKQAANLRSIMELENCDWAEWTRRLKPGGGI